MSFLRPEAMAAVFRWREVLIALVLALIGLNWALRSFGMLSWLGWAILAIAIALLIAGLQRLRFRRGQGGPGVVQVDERQITYFGPLSGGVVALSELRELQLDPTCTPPVWRLIQPGQDALDIPVNAEGSDALFDAFAVLPGIRTENMLAQLRADADHPVVIWHQPAARLH